MTPDQPLAKPVRIITYTDGFNLYYGLKDARYERYLWLDLVRLSLMLLKPGQKIVRVKYFTSRISMPEDKKKRQANYLEALGTLQNLDVTYGHFLDKPMECRSCSRTWMSHEEKMTDVNIATQLLIDAHDDKFDSALMISGDSDLVPPVRAIRQRLPDKRIIAAFPPHRHSESLKQACHGWFNIGRDKLAASQLPDEVIKPDGYKLIRPPSWA